MLLFVLLFCFVFQPGVFGELQLHGKDHITHWTHLATTVYPSKGTRITVTDATDWEAGDEILITSTSFETWQAEIMTIEEVVNERTFVLNDTFKHKHVGELSLPAGYSYILA